MLSHVRTYNWDSEKNRQLMESRGISFEDILFHLERGDLLDDLVHPNRERYPTQRMFIVDVDDYAYLVPYVEDDTEIFLRTIIPSRKATRHYLGASE